MRRAAGGRQTRVCAFNFTPVPVRQFVIGLPGPGTLKEILSSDDVLFGGGGFHNHLINTAKSEFAGQPYRAAIDLPPLAAVYFDYNKEGIES